MDHSTLQAPDNEADEKWANSGTGCSESRGQNHAKAEKKDSGIVADVSVSPSRHGDLTEKSVCKASDEWENRAISPVSMKSNFSMHHPLKFRRTHQSVRRLDESKDSEEDSFDSMEMFNDPNEEYCTSDHSSCSNHSDLEQAPNCAYGDLSDVSILNEAKEKLKERYREEKKCIFVKSEKLSCPILLNDVFIEPYITKEEDEEHESHEHEMREPKLASNRVTSNIFIQYPEKQNSIKTMLTKGIAKIGKTIYLQKLVLSWAEGKTNQEIDLILALRLCDLNLKKKENVSLTELLQHFFPQVKQINLNTVRIMIILDGLDEYGLPLDFQHKTNWTDPNKPTTVDVLLTNLIKGNLLPSAFLWITSRPETADSIPSEYIQKVTKIHGFKDAQKEEYFHKRIRDETKANGIIKHIKTSSVFHGLCHIPAYCSFAASVLQDTMDNTTPQTLIQKLTSFLQVGLQSKALTDLSSTQSLSGNLLS